MPFVSDKRLDGMNKAVLSGRIIPYFAGVLILITLAAALAVRLLARGEFTTYGDSVWWAAQTVTTVGYGDVIPQHTFSKVVAVLVMFVGIATVSVTTAVITSAVIATTQRRRPLEAHADPQLATLERMEERLDALERIEGRLDSIEARLDAR